MIILESIRLRNFRAIREAVFQPRLEGITGIFGSNGAGKTTFLSGTLFALFGTRPPHATVGSLRRTGSGTEECSASVVFQHLGQTVEIIREIKGRTNNVKVDIFVDGIPQTADSGTAADKWMAERLGVDATGFLTAFIVRQKELDALVTAKPSDRKAVIEKLAGIDTINEALKKARKDENTAKAVLESLPGSEKAIEETEAQVQLLTTKVEELRAVKEEKQDELNTLQQELKTLTASIENMRQAEANMLRISSEISNLETSVESDEATINRLNYVIHEDANYDIELLRQQHKDIVSKLTELTQKLNASRVEKAQLINSEEAFIFSINELENNIADFNVTESEEEIESKIQNHRASILELQQNSAVYANKVEDYHDKAKALHGDHKECPTCNTVLDNVDGLIQDFENFASEYEQKQLDNVEKINSLKSELEIIENELRSVKQFSEWKYKLENDRDSLNGIKQRIADLPDLTVVEKAIAKLEADKDIITENGLKAKRFNDDKNEYETANSNLTLKTRKISELYPLLEDLKKSFSETKYESARTRQDTLQREVSSLSNRMNNAYSELSGFESRLSVANNNFRSSVEQWKRKKELLSAQERKALTTELIDKFRQDSIASLAPELSEHATDLISGITSGAYTEIRLDESFNVTVVSSAGEERQVGWLSGGEESAVAFALRLAIAFLITGGNPSLLWLDEVLTAQDADRRASMLTTIKNLPIDQIIMINHTEDANDIVDKTVTVIPNVIKGSVLDSDDGANDNLFDDISNESSDPTAPSSLDEIEDDLTF
jgi:exonuclease SbcC